MKQCSDKSAARYCLRSVFRFELLNEVGCCELCHSARKRPNPNWLHLHEIARGSIRQLAMDKRFAVLVLCCDCHINRIHSNEYWPEARQLAVLKRSRPADYDLIAYNELVGYGPDRITEADVDVYYTERSKDD